MHHRYTFAACAALLACAAKSQDGSAESTAPTPRTIRPLAAGSPEITVLYTNVVGAPSNVVPGTGGLPFAFSTTATNVFGRPNVTFDGQWVMSVDIDTGTTTTDGALLRNGQLLIREGDATTFAPSETWGAMDEIVGVNSLGNVLVTNSLGGAAVSTANDVVVFLNAGGSQTLLAREAQLMDPVVPTFTGATWDDTMDTPVLTEPNLFGWRATGLDNTPSGTTADDAIALFGSAVAYQKGAIPPGQAGGATEAWEIFDSFDFHVSIDGSVTMMQGDLTGATANDDVVAVNGVIVLQENSVIPGSTFVEPIDNAGIVESWVDVAGNWYARGNNDVTEQDWVVRNGAVVAISDVTMEIFPGAGEHWDDTTFSDCFFAFDGNFAGDYIIGGVTDALIDNDGVVVMYPAAGSPFVLAREGDPIDLDGNGMFDDDAFIRTFGNDDCLLLEDGSMYASVTMRNAALAAIGSAFVRIGNPTASCTANNGSGVNVNALTCATLPKLGNTWILDIGLAPSTSATAAFLTFAPSAFVLPPFAPYEILVDFSFALNLPPTAPGVHQISLPRPAEQFWANRPVFVQGFRIDAPGGSPQLVMTNRIDAVFGF